MGKWAFHTLSPIDDDDTTTIDPEIIAAIVIHLKDIQSPEFQQRRRGIAVAVGDREGERAGEVVVIEETEEECWKGRMNEKKKME
ncbi:hypothetical protein RIF29_15867 [Crotalaria pallida]|uniref:Uncharacterized protein n=1 Tax=Crotalaria pallida TaxID=3830 RepID=A0AAN9FEB0_CROPI